MHPDGTGSLELLPAVLDSLGAGIIAVDTAGRIIQFNEAAQRIMGSPITDVPPEQWPARYGIYHDDAVTLYQVEDLPLARALRGESMDNVNVLMRPPGTGQSFWVGASARPIRRGAEIIGATLIFQDITAKRQAAEELRETKERLRYLIGSTPVVLFSSEAVEPFAVTFVSDNVAGVLGWEPAEFREAGSWKARMHPEDRARLEPELGALRERGQHSWEFRFLHKTGEYRWIHSEMRRVSTAEGGPVELVGFLLDITERRRAEDALRGSERNHREFAERLPQTVFECDVAGKVTFINQNGRDSLGYSAADVRTGFSIFDAIAPEDRSRAVTNVSRRLAGEQFPGDEYSVVRKDGTRFPAAVYASAVLKDGVVAGIRGLLIDMTERMRTEETLREWAAVVSASSDAIVKMHDHKITSWNAGAERMYGYTATEAIGRDILMLVPPDRRGDVAEIRARLDRGEPTIQFETQHLRKDGRRIDASVSITPVADASGEFRISATVARDITRQKKEQALVGLLQSAAVAANEAGSIEGAIQACVDGICRYAGWSVGHAWITEEDDHSLMVSAGVWRLDDPERFAEFRELMDQRKLRSGDGLAARVFASGRSCWIGDIATSGLPLANVAVRLGLKAAFASPILAGSSVVGVLEFCSQTSDADESLFEVIASIGVQLGRLVERIRGHRAVVESEMRYRAITETAAHAVVAFSRDGRILVANTTAERIFGYSKEELARLDAIELISERHRDRARAALYANAEASAPVFELLGRHREGSEMRLEISVSSYLEADGARVFTALILDVTKRWEAEAQVRKLSRAVQDSPASIVITNTAGEIEYVNPAFTRVSGYSIEEARGKNPRILKSGQAPQEVYRNLWATITAGGEWRGELQNRKKNGDLFWESASISPVRDADGQITHFIAVKEDITERKRAEADLADALKMLRAVIDGAPLGIAAIDLEGRVQSWNPAAEGIFGWSADEVVGRPLPCVPKEDWPHLMERLAWLAEGRTLESIRALRQRKDGTLVFVEGWGASLRRDDGSAIGFVLEYADLTERKQLEDQLRQAQKLESIGQLAAGIAHEINTPIQYVGDNTKFLRDAFRSLDTLFQAYDRLLDAARENSVTAELLTGVDDAAVGTDLAFLRDEIPRAIQQSLEGVGQVAQIIRAMKEFSHPGPLERTPADLNRALESTALVCRNEWKYVADLETDFDPDLPPVPCLPGDINQVALNLIVNAAHAIADAMRPNGAKGIITVSTRRDGNWAEIRVRDTGTGIPEKIRGRVFDPFFTTKEVGRGTGQGLAIAHSVIVQKHGGRISFETEMGMGTTFVVRLPLEPGNPAR